MQRFGLEHIDLIYQLLNELNIVPIPGTKRRTYLEENVKAATLTLSEADMKTLNDTLPPGGATGNRYNEHNMRLVDR